jgi:hypothetical protein
MGRVRVQKINGELRNKLLTLFTYLLFTNIFVISYFDNVFSCIILVQKLKFTLIVNWNFIFGGLDTLFIDLHKTILSKAL